MGNETSEEKYEFREDTGKSYELAPGAPPVFEHFHHGKIDIRTLTPQTAKELVAAGVAEIIEKQGQPAKPKVAAQ